ncbi:monocarboxylate transporter 13-like [Glandiceps talaboti]
MKVGKEKWNSHKAPPMYKYEDDPPDGGWGWLVVIAAHFSLLLSHGSVTGFGPFIVRLNAYFEDDGAGAVGGISGIAYFVTLATSPLSAGLMNRFGCRIIVFTGGVLATCGLAASSFANEVHHLYITYGVITGFGYGLIVTPVMSYTARYFTKRYARANGLVFAGLAVAWIALPQLCQFWIERYGWRGAMLMLSATTSHLCLCSLAFRPPPQKRVFINEAVLAESSEKHDGDSDQVTTEVEETITKKKITTGFCRKFYRVFLQVFDVTLFSDPLFIVMCCTYILSSIAVFPTFLYLADRAVSYGIPQPLPTTLITIWGVTSLVGRVTHGVIIDNKIVTAAQGLGLAILASGLINIFSIFTTTYIGLAVMYGLFGLFNGVYHPLSTVALKELIGVKKLPQSQGLCQLFRGIGGLIGSPLTGLIYDATLSYNVCYLYSGCVLTCLGAMVIVSVPCIRRYQRRKTSRGSEVQVEG